MAQRDAKFELTEDLVTFRGRVIAVRQIAVASGNSGRPFRDVGLILIAVSVFAIGYDVVGQGRGLGHLLSALQSGGSTLIWSALVVMGLGIFGLVYQKRTLIIRLADGSKIGLAAGSDEFLQRVLSCIGEAIRLGSDRAASDRDPAKRWRAVIDMRAQTLEMGDGAIIQPSPVHTPSTPAAFPESGFMPIDPAAHPDEIVKDLARKWTTPPYRNGHAAPNDPTSAWLLPAGSAYSPSQSGGSALQPAATDAHLAGASTPRTAPVRDIAVRPAREPQNAMRDFQTLLDLVRRSDLQHKTALLELLAVVEDYLKGGGTVQEDAVAHWRSFADYVHQYLTDIEGLVPLTERVGRPFALN